MITSQTQDNRRAAWTPGWEPRLQKPKAKANIWCSLMLRECGTFKRDQLMLAKFSLSNHANERLRTKNMQNHEANARKFYWSQQSGLHVWISSVVHNFTLSHEFKVKNMFSVPRWTVTPFGTRSTPPVRLVSLWDQWWNWFSRWPLGSWR